MNASEEKYIFFAAQQTGSGYEKLASMAKHALTVFLKKITVFYENTDEMT